jgi:hypothetical protein
VCKRVIERLADRSGGSVDDAGVALERVTQAVVVIAQEPATSWRANEVLGASSADALEADGRTRTGDPFITSEVLYQLSYVGGGGCKGSAA